MKSVMYHYVREHSDSHPRLRFLHKDNFARQLDHFQNNYVFPDFDTLIASLKNKQIIENAIILTFDDGLSDHYDYVFPELRKRGLWGMFFPSAAPYTERGPLDVHRIHMLSARHSGSELLRALRDLVQDDMLSDQHRRSFQTQPYFYRDDDDDLKQFKQTLNYYIDYKWRGRVLDQLMNIFLSDAETLFENYYLSGDQMREMRDHGMIFGGHSVTHRVLSKLTREEQHDEILGSFDFLGRVLGTEFFRSFCFPYGGDHTFTEETISLLEEMDCQLGFSVDPREINESDLIHRPLSLPRYDCTFMPHGQSENSGVGKTNA